VPDQRGQILDPATAQRQITGGRARTLQELEALLSQAKLALSKVTATSSGLAVIEALPA